MSNSSKKSTTPITPLTHIIIKGAKQHNLKNISLAIPKNKLVVFSGLSGSGKSTLAFDTLYAEGQRRYVESLSSYARQFLGIMDKPAVDQIEGLSPSISIDQKTTSHNPRSTVGTITEIYDYLRLLFARVGHPHCPECGKEISTQSIDQILDQTIEQIEQQAQEGISRLMILAPVVRHRKGQFGELLKSLQKKGYSRVRIDNRIYEINTDLTLIKTNKHDIEVVVDRLTISRQQLKDAQELQTLRSRLSQSIEQSLKLADGLVVASFIQDKSLNFPENPSDFKDVLFSEKLACSECGISMDELEPSIFSFNSPLGACETCHGLGSILEIDPEKIVAPELTLSEGAIIPFARMLSSDSWFSRIVASVLETELKIFQTKTNQKIDFSITESFRQTPFCELPDEIQQSLLYGTKNVYEVTGENRFGKIVTINKEWEGFIVNLERRFEETNSEYIRNEINKYQKKTTCPACHGARLKPKSLSVTIDKLNISEVTALTISDSLDWINSLEKQKIFNEKEAVIAQSIIKEIGTRLSFLNSVGLNYLTLAREAGSLAGGEAQRIRLASQIGTGLTGVLYILDEPTIGLHQRDNQRLIKTLKELRDRGNSVVVVEHDEDVILAADEIVEFGPAAGNGGGKIVAQGNPQTIKESSTITGDYLSKKKVVARERVLPSQLELKKLELNSIVIKGAKHHNLKNIDVKFPLHRLVCVTGVSGSGKSTLIHDTLYQHLLKQLSRQSQEKPGSVDFVNVPPEVKSVKLIDQTPIGKTPRSNPATYTKVFDLIRQLYANTKEARIRGYSAGRFSFNVKGGRCEACQGDGQIKIEMQFLSDVYVTCDVCKGKRYNQETLQVKYQGKSIADVLELTIEEAYEFFRQHSTIRKKLKTMIDVGLGYLRLGQPAPTLSGGEAQRVKISRELSANHIGHNVYLLDEPTTGLHFADVQKLLNVLHKLVEQNNSVIVIEHNLDIIRNADWIIDLGPEGGDRGGKIVATGTPNQVANNNNSYTGQYLKKEKNK